MKKNKPIGNYAKNTKKWKKAKTQKCKNKNAKTHKKWKKVSYLKGENAKNAKRSK